MPGSILTDKAFKDLTSIDPLQMINETFPCEKKARFFHSLFRVLVDETELRNGFVDISDPSYDYPRLDPGLELLMSVAYHSHTQAVIILSNLIFDKKMGKLSVQDLVAAFLSFVENSNA